MSITKEILSNSSYFILKDKYLLLKKADKTLPTEQEFKKIIGLENCSSFEKATTKDSAFSKAHATLFSERQLGYTAISFTDEPIPSDYEYVLLREYIWEKDSSRSEKASRAMGIANWLQHTKHCCCCGGLLIADDKETCLKCPDCHEVFFPRISPCIIVLVTRGNEMLLARHKMRNTNLFTCIAGFIEHGESAEGCVHREVKEETGLNVKNVRYIASQSWPFPDQMMFAFRAEYDSGEIKVQEDEITEAHWFSKENVPTIPKPGSVAYKLINGFLTE